MQTSAAVDANQLLRRDIARLEEMGYRVDVVVAGSQVGVIVRGVELPLGAYNHTHTDVLIQTTDQYPLSAMDMFWVDQPLALADGRVPAGAESVEVHFDQTWRRFSWHRNCEWVPGRDDLVGHFEFALARLQKCQ